MRKRNPDSRRYVITVRMSLKDKMKLEEIADTRGRSMSDVMLSFLRDFNGDPAEYTEPEPYRGE